MEIIVEADESTTKEIEHLSSTGDWTAARVKQSNLDGSLPSWIVVLTLALPLAQSIVEPVIGRLLEKIINLTPPTVQVGDVVFHNPSAEDLTLMREAARKRLLNG
jgi:hypothetical protein